MQKITPFIWYRDNNAEEAAEFYTSVFKDGKITNKMPGPGGKPMGLSVELLGQELRLFNGGPVDFKLNESISLFVDCDTQEEVDYYWEKLGEGGKHNFCGWLKDKYGLSWQVIPRQLGELLGGQDKEKAMRAMQAMMKMTKIDIAELATKLADMRRNSQGSPPDEQTHR